MRTNKGACIDSSVSTRRRTLGPCLGRGGSERREGREVAREIAIRTSISFGSHSPFAAVISRGAAEMTCTSRQWTGEHGDYLVTANEIIRSPRAAYQVHTLWCMAIEVLARGV